MPRSGNFFRQLTFRMQTLCLYLDIAFVPAHLDPFDGAVVTRIERIGKAENARQQRDQFPLFHWEIAQPGGLRKSATMIARDVSHGYNFLPRPANDRI
jgi:hypothetical protein